MKYLHTLTIVFIVLKLTDYIDWSWVLVLLPSLLPILFIISVISVGVYQGVKNPERAAIERIMRKFKK